MEIVHVEKRLTHKYRDRWSNLDNWQYVAQLKLTTRKKIAEGNGYDEGPTYVQFAYIPKGIKFKELRRAIVQTMGSRGRCSHEYDCCGCASYYVTAKLHSKRQVMIRTSVGYNY